MRAGYRSFAAECAALLFCLSMGIQTAQAQKVLRWKFEPGDSRDMTIVQTIHVAVTAADQNVEMRMSPTMVLRQVIDSVNAEGIASVTQRFVRIQMKLEGAPGASFAYDSNVETPAEGPIGSMIAPIFGALTKGKFTAHISPRGEILDVQVPEEMTDAMARAAGLPGVAEIFSKDGLNQLLKQNAAKFPEQAVIRGDSWTDSLELNNPILGKQTIKTKFTYAGEEVVNDRKVDKMSVTLSFEFGDPPANAPAKIKVSEQAASGVMRFDAATGQLVGSEIDQTMKMEINALGNVLNQTIKSKTIVTVAPSPKSANP